MPLTYVGANGLFTRIGKIVRRVLSEYATVLTDLDTDLDGISDQFEAADNREDISGLIASFNGFRNNIVAWRQQLALYVDATLKNKAEVLDQLNVAQNDIDTILRELIRQMNDDAETIDGSVVTIAAVTADANNAGNGTVLTTKVLDGYTAPLVGAQAQLEYNGIDSELAVPSDTMTLRCVLDSQRDGLTEGEERFEWHGQESYPEWHYRDEGAGLGPQVTVLNAETILSNRNFENFTSGAPDNWTVELGTAGENLHGTANPDEVYRGSQALVLRGGGVAQVQISQAPSISLLRPRRMYCFAARYRMGPSVSSSSSSSSSSSAAGEGVLDIRFRGTGYTPTSSEVITVREPDFSDTWALVNFFIRLPDPIPTDWALRILAENLDRGQSIFVDSLAFGPVVYHNGHGVAVIAGNNRFMQGDRFTYLVTNDQAGDFQEFFRRHFRVQLPSRTDGAETIADSLVAA